MCDWLGQSSSIGCWQPSVHQFLDLWSKLGNCFKSRLRTNDTTTSRPVPTFTKNTSPKRTPGTSKFDRDLTCQSFYVKLIWSVACLQLDVQDRYSYFKFWLLWALSGTVQSTPVKLQLVTPPLPDIIFFSFLQFTMLFWNLWTKTWVFFLVIWCLHCVQNCGPGFYLKMSENVVKSIKFVYIRK